MLRVMPVSSYCQLYGETKAAVDRRIERGIWVKGIHWYIPPNVKERWLDLEAIEKWARGQKQTVSRVA